jgi:hypothetical protein
MDRAEPREDISLESSKGMLYNLMLGDQEVKEKPKTVMELFSKSKQDSHDAWRLFSKAKGALEDGERLENISWRLFHMKLSKENVFIWN